MLTRRNLPIFLVVCCFAASAGAKDQAAVPGATVRVVVTVEGQKDAPPPPLTKDDVMVYLDNQRVQVTDWTPIQNDRIGLQLWLLIDDGAQTSLGNQLADLRKFVLDQSPATQVGIGYMRNGSVLPVQKLTTDHALAAKAIRLPLGQPGAAVSPYQALTELIHKWPAGEQARQVVLVSSGIDLNNGPDPVNPFLDQAIKAAQRGGVVVHSIYYGEAGHFGHSFWQINWGQNYLSRLAEETGGEFFWQGDSNPVSFDPYLKELNQHFSNQHVLTFLAPGAPGVRRLKLQTEVPHAMLVGPLKVYVPGGK